MVSRLEKLIARIDRANKEDPNRARLATTSYPHEYVYSLWLTEWVKALRPDASEFLLIASRGQHIRRWTSPRSSFPEGRTGYLQWRSELKKFHAETVASMMGEEGYTADEQSRVRDIILKVFESDSSSGSTEISATESSSPRLVRSIPSISLWTSTSPRGATTLPTPR